MERYSYDSSVLANGGCYLCARTDNLVSTSKVIEGEGLLALCSGCINDAAVTAGFAVNAQGEIERTQRAAEALADQLAEAEAERDAAQAKLTAMREQWVEAVEAKA